MDEFFGSIALGDEVAEWKNGDRARDEALSVALEGCYESPAAREARRCYWRECTIWCDEDCTECTYTEDDLRFEDERALLDPRPPYHYLVVRLRVHAYSSTSIEAVRADSTRCYCPHLELLGGEA